jgi:hypothetical protein
MKWLWRALTSPFAVELAIVVLTVLARETRRKRKGQKK